MRLTLKYIVLFYIINTYIYLDLSGHYKNFFLVKRHCSKITSSGMHTKILVAKKIMKIKLYALYATCYRNKYFIVMNGSKTTLYYTTI